MIKNYKIQQRLGIGSYGTVYQVIDINTKNKYVIKQILLNDLSREEISNVKLEAKILSSINSKYVVKYYDSFQENNNLDIVMEYCD
jgi:NIMA (never in mitosis gene a)-related kinase